jgi:tetratricopeptide (TPR) repeat protein
VEIDASEIDAHFQLGRIARAQGRAADAIRHFEPVVARDPRYARYEVWREVGGTYVDAGDFANARPMLERYVDNRPYDPEGLYLLGLVLKKLGEAEKAREVLLRCVDASKTAPDYRKGELRRWRKKAQAEL